jgi:type I restriction enzyme S subunit
MNETLEAMARALFKSWFVDFDPIRAKLDGRQPPGLDSATAALFPDRFQDSPVGQIPEGWEVGSILKQANLLSGGTPKTAVSAYWNGNVQWASAKDVSQCSDSFLISTERTITERGLKESSTKIIPRFSTVIVARGATTGRLTMLGSPMAMNQTCYALESKFSAPFTLYCHSRSFIDTLVHSAHGSIFDTITTQTFEKAELCLPPPDIQREFDKRVAPFFTRILTTLIESKALTSSRDILLPKLLGETLL